jgi:23S rRNA (cytosine1962-C5)-methyltransferase
MQKKWDWPDQKLVRAFEAEGTNAYRLCTLDNGWAERFGPDILISFKNVAARDRLVFELHFWAKSVGLHVGRVFARFLPRKNEEREAPRLLFGDSSENLKTVATERFLKFGIDFGGGYSVGLFVDQRENRHYVRKSAPKQLLNCFAYTCSFSVAAASVGAHTVNVDLSKKSLARGRENFGLNGLPTSGHEFAPERSIGSPRRQIFRRAQRPARSG